VKIYEKLFKEDHLDHIDYSFELPSGLTGDKYLGIMWITFKTMRHLLYLEIEKQKEAANVNLLSPRNFTVASMIIQEKFLGIR
jgi:hypothetical protein